MQSKHEHREYDKNIQVWVGKYKNLSNLSHWHSDYEIIYAEKGGAAVTIGKNAYRLEEGNAVFIHSCETHSVQGDKNSVLVFFLFMRALLKNIVKGSKLCSPLLACDYGFPALYGVLHRELQEPRGRLTSYSVNNRIERLAIDVFTNEKTRQVEETESNQTERYHRLLNEIDKNYAAYTLDDAANFLALSSSHFSKFFKSMANTTFTKYLNLVRVEKAVEMLQEGRFSVTRAALESGFGTIRNFNRVFKEITGYAPRELPSDYNPLSPHPVYGPDNHFDPTDKNSELLND